MSTARVALAAARPYVSAAANAGGGKRALQALDLLDKALREFRDEEKPVIQTEGEWTPPGGWPTEE